jgi:uncharacterized protein
MSDPATQSSAQSGGGSRISSLDCLRGLAIVGTLGTNIWTFSYLGGDLEVLFGPKEWWSDLNDFLLALTLYLTNGKFLGLLAILFGVGLQLQLRSAVRRGTRFAPRYAWRNFLLLAIGFIHFVLVYGYDILMGYALASLVVMALAIGGRTHLISGMIAALVLHVLIYGVMCMVIDPSGHDPVSEYVSQALATGSYTETVWTRLNLALYFRFEVVTLLGLNTVLMGLGVLLTRAGLFDGQQNGRLLARRLVIIGLAIGLPLNLANFYPDARVALAARYFLAPVMSLGFLGLGVLLLQSVRGPITRALEVVGRTALTCYILQNLLAAIVFYGWGLGLKGHFNAPGTLLVWLLITLTYVAVMALWLRWFRQGPVEWAWRKLA